MVPSSPLLRGFTVIKKVRTEIKARDTEKTKAMKTETNKTKEKKQTKETKVIMKKTDCSRTILKIKEEEPKIRRNPAGKK